MVKETVTGLFSGTWHLTVLSVMFFVTCLVPVQRDSSHRYLGAVAGHGVARFGVRGEQTSAGVSNERVGGAIPPSTLRVGCVLHSVT